MRKFLFCTLCICLLAGICNIWAQNETVSLSWGKVFGRAYTDRDFLIYDATCPRNGPAAIYIVGKAEYGTGVELKQTGNSYFYEKDEYTDAFLACISLEGELLWSTYLPALEAGYYNAFATTIQDYYSDSTFFVLGNSYRIQNDLSQTKNLIPVCEGKLFYFEFSLDGRLLRSKISTLDYPLDNLSRIYPPRLFKGFRFLEDENRILHLSGISYIGEAIKNSDGPNDYIYSGACNVRVDWQDKIDYNFVLSSHYTDHATVYSSHYFLSYDLSQPSGFYQSAYLLHHLKTEKEFWVYPAFSGLPFKGADTIITNDIYSRGLNFVGTPPLRERWKNVIQETKNGISSYADPLATLNDMNQSIFPGTVQNIQTYKDKILVQGIHCRNYDNGFFKKDGKSYAYSHDTVHLIPKSGHSFYRARNKNLTAVPYLMLYDSATLFGTIAINKDSATNNIYDFQHPLWGTYLNTDWFYEDFFHVTDSGHRKDLYQPYEPILCSYGDRFFLIGNTRSIGTDLVDDIPMTEEIYHHQGVILSFQMGCPPEKTAFDDVRFLCPGDSVELRMPEEYTGFTFRFDPSMPDNASVLLNSDSSRAWVRQEGIYRAVLDGSAIGCPDALVDSVRISLSPYPEPVSALPEDTTVSCAAFKPLFQAVAQHDSSFSYRWYDGDTLWQKNCPFAGDSLQPVSVTVNGYCTSFTDTAFIRFLPPYVDLGNDTLLCHTGMPADTALLLHLDANQDYFPAADWIFRWHINKREAGRGDSLLLHFSDLDSVAPSHYQAIASVSVALSDTATDGCTANDTITLDLFVLPDTDGNVFLSKDSILCAHLDLELQLPEESGNFLCFWLDRDSITLPFGNDTNCFVVQGLRGTDGFGANTDSRNPRFFQLKLEHRHCPAAFLDTLLVYDQVRPTFALAFHDTVVCLDEPVALDSLKPFVYRPFYAFEWNDGKIGSDYSFADSGTYILRFFVREDFDVCDYDEASDTLRVLWSDPAMTLISIPEDTSFCERLSVTLDASVPFPSTRYCWQEGNLDDLVPPTEDSALFTPPVLKVDREVSYALFLLDTLGCLNTQQINIHEEDCRPKLEIPNVFTPNGDGINDVWKFTQLEQCYNVDILVVDRKGSHVLHEKVADADDFSWNGCYRNGSRKLPDGPYFYMVSYRDAYGKKKVQSGSVTILGTAE